MSTLVLVELEGGAVSTLSLEALTFARQFGEPVEALLVGGTADGMAEGAAEAVGAHGVPVLHHADDPRLADWSAAAAASAVADCAAEVSPSVLLAPASPRGNEVMAHVAARTGLRMAANVTAVPSPGVVHRQVMGGSALEELDLPGVPGAPALVTMAGHAVEPDPVPGAVPAAVQAFTPSSITDADLLARVRRSIPAASSASDLATARVVVGGGRGVGGPDGFEPLIELAGRLGGTLGVSRVVTSLGWRPHHEQVGQTGSRITPDLYLACGISGAIQHWAGCSSAKTIIAVNTDAEAPMVTKAHYAVIADLHELVPALNRTLSP